MAKKADIEIKKSNAGKFTAWAKKNILCGCFHSNEA